MYDSEKDKVSRDRLGLKLYLLRNGKLIRDLAHRWGKRASFVFYTLEIVF